LYGETLEMQSKTKSHIFLTLNGETLFDFWIDETSDKGFCLGPSIESPHIHLTTFIKNGKIRHHVKHKGIAEPSDESPLSGQISTKLVENKIQKIFTKRLKYFHGNKKCFIFTQDRWERIKEKFRDFRFDAKGNLIIPLELHFSQIDMDFSNKNLWQKVRIRSLLTHEPNYGYIKTKKGLRWIVPISKNQMLSCPLSKIDELNDYLSKIIGIDDLFDYLVAAGVEKEKLLKNKSGIK